MELEAGNIYIIRNSDEKYRVYLDARKKAKRGLFITRKNPSRLDEEIRKSSTLIWLSSIKGKDTLDPYNVGILTDRISEYISDSHKAASVIFLDGIEYMMEVTDFSRVFRSLGYIQERISLTDSLMIVPIDENTIEKREIALMKREFVLKEV